MARYGRTLLFTAPQESISPTAAGMNITGIIWSRKLLAFFTAVTGRSFSSSHRNRITIPYMLAGTGRGSRMWKTSPQKEMDRIIPNCFRISKGRTSCE